MEVQSCQKQREFNRMAKFQYFSPSLGRFKRLSSLEMFSLCIAISICSLALIGFAQPPSVGLQVSSQSADGAQDSPTNLDNNLLPLAHQRPNVTINVEDWTRRLSEDIQAVSKRTNCLRTMEQSFNELKYVTVNPNKTRDQIINHINTLLAQHRDAVTAIVQEAEKLAVQHNFVKDLRFNYTDVHRLRNELDQLNVTGPSIDPATGQPIQDSLYMGWSSQNMAGTSGGAGGSGSQVPQFTSINGGTPVPGPPEWQTPVRSIVMQVNKNFGDIPVNTSMSAIHLPLPIYAGLPEIMNGIAWTEKIDSVFKRNLANYMHVHHQYYGDHLGFMRTFPAHKWRIPRNEPDLFDARTRPWYVAGASSPKDVVILVDTSGSMTGLRREIAKGVVFEILDTLTSNDFFTVMRFSETLTPVGLPRCQKLLSPKTGAAMAEQCNQTPDTGECRRYRLQLEQSFRYLDDHPNVVPGKNGSYLTNEQYWQSIYNVSSDISGAYLLPATSRNIRYLKSNFSMPTAGIANFTHALMGAFELLQAYNRSGSAQAGSQCNQAIMLITDGAIKSHDDIFNRYNYPNAPIRVFTYMIGREVGDITHTKAMACNNRGYYTHVINLGEVREQVQKYLPVMARPMVLGHHHPVSWTYAYGDETHQVLTDWVLELKRRERARIMLNEERERFNDMANSSEANNMINIELTNIQEYDELPLVDEELKNRIICEDDPEVEQSLHEELDPLGYNDLGCHWTSRRADLLTSVVKPVFDNRNTTLYFQRILQKNIWIELPVNVRNAQLLGVAAVDLRIADIMRLAPSYLLGPNGYTILMGQNGFVLHHPDLRALLEDPFDKQSKILKPYFNSVDLTHVEQVHSKNNSELEMARYENALLQLRKVAARGQPWSTSSLPIKRAVDCKRRVHVARQSFYIGDIKDTPFSFILVLPSYGFNKLDSTQAMKKVDQDSKTYFQPSDMDLWTVHPDYRYCESHPSHSAKTNSQPINNGSSPQVSTILEVLNSVDSMEYGDLLAVSTSSERHTSVSSAHYTCDKELFPALVFDAKATYQTPDTFCSPLSPSDNCDRPATSAFSSFMSSANERAREESCARSPDEMRNVLASIYGLELSFLATRSGLTRVKVFESTDRIKILADLFITRHNKAVDEAWYSRTVDWNMRSSQMRYIQMEDTIITAPYNAYIRLIAKLRQRITERHPALNGTGTNCQSNLTEPGVTSPSEGSSTSETSPNYTGETSASLPSVPSDVSGQVLAEDTSSSSNLPSMSSYANEPTNSTALINDEPVTSPDQATGSDSSVLMPPEIPEIDYSKYSSFDFLNLIENSSVHISATQTIIAHRDIKQHAVPVGVTGLLYDYAKFAARFLNSTSLNIKSVPDQESDNIPGGSIKVDLCPNGECPSKCGFRNDTIDCLLIDNNGFIVVGEELPYIGRSLVDYDEKLLESLTNQKVFRQVQLTDYQAICTRSNEPIQQQASDQNKFAQTIATQSSSSSSSSLVSIYMRDVKQRQFEWNFVGLFMANLISSMQHIWSALYSLLVFQTTLTDIAEKYWLGELMHLHRSVVDAQSAIANQSMLALLPNKTYLRPCEKTITLYEMESSYSMRQHRNQPTTIESPEYFLTKCNCSSWYVYGFVEKTNLIMIIVNTTSSCRKCDNTPSSVAVTAPNALATPLENLATGQPPVSGPNGYGPTQINGFNGNGYTQGNKTAEDQVCVMLEREAALLESLTDNHAKRPETCHSYNPDEAQIHICGKAPKSAPISLNLILTCCTLLILLLSKTITAEMFASLKLFGD